MSTRTDSRADRAPIGDEVAAAIARGEDVATTLKIVGRVRAELRGPDGRLKAVEEVENLITTVGRNFIVEQLLASPTAATKPTHMGVGTGTVAPTVGDTTMTAEVRVALTSKTRGTNILTLVGDWAAGSATQANTEAGVWDAASAGSLHARATFAAINKGASDTLKITWTWTIG
jgi:hypothetical protein